MAQPADVIFGPSGRSDRWWAVLPSNAALHASNVSDLLSDVERVMAHDEPDRPYAYVLDLYGAREPGAPGRPPRDGSAAHLLALRRSPPADRENATG